MGYSQSAGLALATIFYLLIGVRSLLDCEVWPGDCAALEPLTYGAVSQMSGGDTRMAMLTTEVFLPLQENGNEFFHANAICSAFATSWLDRLHI